MKNTLAALKMRFTTTVAQTASIAALLLLAACSTYPKTEVSISNLSSQEVTLYQLQPLAGAATIIVTDTITLGGNTTTIQTLGSNPPAHYTIYSQSGERFHRVQFPLAGGTVMLSYDPESERGFTIDQGSTNAQGLRLFDSLATTRSMYGHHRSFDKAPLDTIASVMQSNFRALADGQIAQFEELLAAQAISQRMADQASWDINYYFAYKMAEAIAQNAMEVSRARAPRQYEGYAELWRELYTLYPIDRKATSTYSGWFYAGKLAQFDRFVINPKAPQPTIKSAAGYMQYEWDGISRALATAEPELQQLILGQSLWNMGVNNNSQEMKLDTLIGEFNTKFKGSAYAPYLQRFVDENREYQKILAHPLSDKVIFVENPDSVESLAELFARFKGQPLFVDFWFSSCGPCRDEFAHAAKTYDFLTQNGITPLFISIDQARNDQQWRDAIKFFNLEGNHLRMATDELSRDIFDVHKIQSFPTYMIVDKDGKVIVSNARRPSQGDELYQQLKEKLQL